MLVMYAIISLSKRQKGDIAMSKVQSTIHLVLKVVAIGMAISSLVLAGLDLSPLSTTVILLSIGLFSLALAYLSESE